MVKVPDSDFCRYAMIFTSSVTHNDRIWKRASGVLNSCLRYFWVTKYANYGLHGLGDNGSPKSRRIGLPRCFFRLQPQCAVLADNTKFRVDRFVDRIGTGLAKTAADFFSQPPVTRVP